MKPNDVFLSSLIPHVELFLKINASMKLDL